MCVRACACVRFIGRGAYVRAMPGGKDALSVCAVCYVHKWGQKFSRFTDVAGWGSGYSESIETETGGKKMKSLKQQLLNLGYSAEDIKALCGDLRTKVGKAKAQALLDAAAQPAADAPADAPAKANTNVVEFEQLPDPWDAPTIVCSPKSQQELQVPAQLLLAPAKEPVPIVGEQEAEATVMEATVPVPQEAVPVPVQVEATVPVPEQVKPVIVALVPIVALLVTVQIANYVARAAWASIPSKRKKEWRQWMEAGVELGRAALGGQRSKHNLLTKLGIV